MSDESKAQEQIGLTGDLVELERGTSDLWSHVLGAPDSRRIRGVVHPHLRWSVVRPAARKPADDVRVEPGPHDVEPVAAVEHEDGIDAHTPWDLDRRESGPGKGCDSNCRIERIGDPGPAIVADPKRHRAEGLWEPVAVGGTNLDDQVVAITAAIIGYGDGVKGATVDSESLQVIPLVADLLGWDHAPLGRDRWR